jgi:hypothetical protein
MLIRGLAVAINPLHRFEVWADPNRHHPVVVWRPQIGGRPKYSSCETLLGHSTCQAKVSSLEGAMRFRGIGLLLWQIVAK